MSTASHQTEQSPLLDPSPETAGQTDYSGRDDVYRRFSTGKKRRILAVVSWAGVIPLFASGSFMPSIPQIARDLNSTGAVISLTVSLSIFGTAIGGLIFAAYSTFYGRRMFYVYGLPIFCVASLGVSFAQNVMQVMIWRLLQAFGMSAGLTIGTAVIGDIYPVEERGSAMGTFFAACLVGPALAPFVGGLATHYFSWRHMQYCLCIDGVLAFVLVLFYLPETCHPGSRGIDKYMRVHDGPSRPWKWVWINPFKSLLLFRSPPLAAVCFAGLSAMIAYYVLLVPLAYTIGERYHITNEALIGACFLPAGLGNLVGAPLAGRLSDRIVVKLRKRRNGKWVPEDRLRACLWGAAVLVPLSTLVSGLLTQYVDGPVGLALNLVCLFLNGLGVDVILSPSAAYNVDVMQSRSAEVVAVNSGVRSILVSVSITAIFPLINAYGVAITNAIAAVIGWLGFLLLWCTIRYGQQMRAWSKVEDSVTDSS